MKCLEIGLEVLWRNGYSFFSIMNQFQSTYFVAIRLFTRKPSVVVAVPGMGIVVGYPGPLPETFETPPSSVHYDAAIVKMT